MLARQSHYISFPQVTLWFKWGESHIGSWMWTLGPWMVVLFGEIVEPLGGRALFEEVAHLLCEGYKSS